MNIELVVENNVPKIYHFYRDPKTMEKKVIIDDKFRPYFFVDENEDVFKDDRIISVEKGYKCIIGGRPLKKITVKMPLDVMELRKHFPRSYEADLQYTKRWMIDKEPDFGAISILIIDIEVDDSGSFPKPEEAKYGIKSISAFSDLKNKFYTLVLGENKPDENIERLCKWNNKKYPWKIRYYTNEIDLLKGFISLVQHTDPDIISGWNVIRFDLEYLLKRMENIKIDYRGLSPLRKVRKTLVRPGLINKREKYRDPPEIAGRTVFDALSAYKRIERKGIESYSLNAISMKELGIGKASTKRIFEMSEKELIEYNCMDVELVMCIEEKRKVIDYFWEMANFIKCPINHTQSFSQMGDTFMLRKKGSFVFPSVTKTESETFEGATVFPPPKGLFENVVVFDLTSLYPSIIMSCNISPETVVPRENADVIVDEVGLYTTTKFDGFIPRVMKDLFEERDKYRKILESGIYKRGTKEWTLAWNKSEYVKQLANSVYGLFSYKGFRLFVPKLSETTTYMGRKVLEWSKKIAENEGYNVIYGDTDSIFITGFGGDFDNILENAEKLRIKLNNSYDELMLKFGMKKHRLSIKFEEIFDKLVFTGVKKRYFGHMVFKRGQKVDMLDVIGFEIRRSDTSQLTKDFQMKLMLSILKKEPKEVVDKFIYETISSIKEKRPSEIAIPKGIVMDIDKYYTNSAHIRGAKYANLHMNKDYDSGDKVKFLYISKQRHGLPKTDVICFDEDSDIDGFTINYDKMLDLLIFRKVEPLYDALGWKFIEDKNQSTINQWC